MEKAKIIVENYSGREQDEQVEIVSTDSIVFQCKDSDYRIYISNDRNSITITKIGKTDDTIQIIPVVSNKIIIK